MGTSKLERLLRPINALLTPWHRQLVVRPTGPSSTIPAPAPPAPQWTYNFDGLSTVHNCDFLQDDAFYDAYYYVAQLIGKDYFWFWRNYIGLKLAELASRRTLNFVECGVGEGWMTLSILRLLAKQYKVAPYFTLFDTFRGIDVSIVDPEEEAFWGVTAAERRDMYGYHTDADVIIKRLHSTAIDSSRIQIVPGSLPGSLTASVKHKIQDKGPIGFLHIDMNNSVPEVAALESLYPLVIDGGFILLDDYAYQGYEFQKRAIDELCMRLGIGSPISLPTGQGLIIR